MAARRQVLGVWSHRPGHLGSDCGLVALKKGRCGLWGVGF